MMKSVETIHQQDAEAMFLGPTVPKLFCQDRGFATTISVAISASEIIFEFADAFFDGFLGISARRSDIAQFYQLLKSLGRADEIEFCFRWVTAVVPWQKVPALDWPNFGWLFECSDENFSIHVCARRQSEQSQNSGADVEEASAEEIVIGTQLGALKAHYAEMAVLDSGSGSFSRDVTWPEMVRMKSVVTHENDSGILVCQLEQGAQHGVMITVAIGDDVLVNGKILFGHGGRLGGRVPHEGMPEVIDAAIINGCKIPGLIREQLSGDGVNGHGFGDDLS